MTDNTEYGRQRNESPGIAVFHERFIDAEPAGDECAYACDRNAREQEYLHAEQKYAEYDENDYQCHDVFCLKYPIDSGYWTATIRIVSPGSTVSISCTSASASVLLLNEPTTNRGSPVSGSAVRETSFPAACVDMTSRTTRLRLSPAPPISTR